MPHLLTSMIFCLFSLTKNRKPVKTFLGLMTGSRLSWEAKVGASVVSTNFIPLADFLGGETLFISVSLGVLLDLWVLVGLE